MGKVLVKDLFFSFASFDEEIRKKLVSMETPPDVLIDALFILLRDHSIDKNVFRKLKKIFQEFLSKTSWEGEHNYLAHPIRVAASLVCLGEPIDYNILALALCHNLKEKLGAAFTAMDETFLSQRVKASIETLTIERASERDPEYLEKFYSRLEGSKEGLMLLKSLDKLDNVLSWVLWDIDPYHAEVVLRYVCPRIASCYPRLERYLRELVGYVSSAEAKAEFRLPAPSRLAP